MTTTISVGSNVTSSGLSISSGTIFDVLSGGTAALNTLAAGGLEIALGGAVDTGTTVSAGGTLIANQSGLISFSPNAFGDLVLSGGLEIAVFQGWVRSANVSGGSLIVSSAGIADTATVTDGGTFTILSSGSGGFDTIGPGGEEVISPGGFDSASIIEGGGFALDAGSALSDVVQSGGSLQVNPFGEAVSTLISGGIGHAGFGGSAVLTTIEAGGVLSATGELTDTRATVGNGGTLFVFSNDGGMGATSDTVSAGGTAIASSAGWLESTTIIGGNAIVSSQGLMQDGTVESGGTVTVMAKGFANLMTLGGAGAGTEIVSAGGSAMGTMVGDGGLEIIDGKDTNEQVMSGGSAIVSSGGQTSFTTVSSGGAETVLAGGSVGVAVYTAYGLVANGGFIGVSDGGVTRGPVVENGGREIVFSSGSAIVPTLGAGGTLEVRSAGTLTGAVLISGGNADLIVDDSAAPSVPVAGFTALGDTLDLTQLIFGGDTGVAFDSGGDTLTVSEGGTSATWQLAGADYGGVIWKARSDSGGGTEIFVACFARGTRIATPAGMVAVERLREGDRVALARGGAAPVQWIGHRRIDCGRHANPGAVLPVRIRAGAFGDGLPLVDLLLSPDHAVFLHGILVPIRHLANGRTIVQVRVRAIDYYHLELPAHGVILAEGLPVESYLDTGNRAFTEGPDRRSRTSTGFRLAPE